MYYQVKVKITTEDEKSGKLKKHTEVYLTEAVSVTDAEATTVEREFKDASFDYEVISVSETKIVKVLS